MAERLDGTITLRIREDRGAPYDAEAVAAALLAVMDKVSVITRTSRSL